MLKKISNKKAGFVGTLKQYYQLCPFNKASASTLNKSCDRIHIFYRRYHLSLCTLQITEKEKQIFDSDS